VDRRIAGLVLIGVVLLAAVVAPNMGVRNVPGTPEAAPVAGPPAVGDCVTDPVDPGWNLLEAQPGTPGVTVGTYAYPSLGMSPCGGRRYGEVVAVIPNPSKPVVTVTNDDNSNSSTVVDPNLDTCYPAAGRYAGMAATGIRPEPTLKDWYPQLRFGSSASAPSKRQRAAGQHWLACFVYLLPAGGTAAEMEADERYDGSLRNALTTGKQRNRLGSCNAGDDLNPQNGAPGDCDTVHLSEMFALGNTDSHPTSRAELQRSCRQLVQQLTRIPDITAVGPLTSQMQATDDSGALIEKPQLPPNTNLTCGIIVTDPTRHLNGSLLALGGQRIPWA